jgi:hypothetical protein
MATPAERFVREAPAIRRLEAPPPDWEAAVADEPWVAVHAAELRGVDGRVQLLTPGADATERQQRGFSAARSAWQRYGGEDAVVPVFATGEEPRPWLALDPPGSGTRLGGEPLPETAVRAVLTDLAEGCWAVRRSPWRGAPDPRRYRIAANGTSAAVYWPLSDNDGDDSRTVRALGEIGYEAITGEKPTTDENELPAAVRENGRYSERLCGVVEAALTAPRGGYADCYELKRALLFGTETERTGEQQRAAGRRQAGKSPAATGRSEDGERTPGDEPAGREPTADRRATAGGRFDVSVGRRAVVSALGLSAVPLAGAFAVRSPDDAAGSPTPEPPEASFAFADEGTAIRVTHTGGDPIAADRLIVRNTRYSGTDDYEWAPFSAEETVEPGDTISIDLQGRVRMFAHVVWQSPDGEEVVLDRRRSVLGTGEEPEA